MSAHRIRWLIFLVCGSLLGVALGWVTWVAVDIEEKGHDQRVENLELELKHLALARLDSALTTILAKESSRPWFHYASFFEPGPAYSPSFTPVFPDGYLVPSPLMKGGLEFSKLYFSIDPNGDVSSPALPSGERRELAVEQGLLSTTATLQDTERRLRDLAQLVTREELLIALERLGPTRKPPYTDVATETLEPLDIIALAEDAEQQRQRAVDEFRFRNRLMMYANVVPQQLGTTPVHQTAFVPYLAPSRGDPELLFVREVRVGEDRAVQGFWADWPSLHRFLRSQVSDLYPLARLFPARGTTEGLLATIPFALDPGPRPEYVAAGMTSTRIALLGLWIALLAAALAVGITMQKTLELSERRRRFVSAVTHELRTPLTTFCMYSELLADGIVTDGGAQQEYFTTLKTESVRLRRIVENVLNYARLEGRRFQQHRELIEAEALLDRILPILERRVAETELELVLDLRTRPDCAVEVDVQTVEQILFNLIDNACKYGADAADPRVHLEAEATRDELVVSVLDHGPGISPERALEVFKPFRRAAGDAEGTTPGIGLGLALARGMAREFGGDVRLVERGGFGAVFEFRLPLRTVG